MFFNFRRLKTGAVVVLAMLSMPVAGQDLWLAKHRSTKR